MSLSYLCLTRLDHFNSFEHIFCTYSIFAGDQPGCNSSSEDLLAVHAAQRSVQRFSACDWAKVSCQKVWSGLEQSLDLCQLSHLFFRANCKKSRRAKKCVQCSATECKGFKLSIHVHTGNIWPNLNRGQRIWPEVLRLSEEFREVLRPSLQWFSMYVLTVAPARIISKSSILSTCSKFWGFRQIFAGCTPSRWAKARFAYCKCQKESTRALTQVPKCQLSQRDSHPQLVKCVPMVWDYCNFHQESTKGLRKTSMEVTTLWTVNLY